MILLAIETSTDICGLALIRDGQCESLVEDCIPKRHAETLPLYTTELLEKTKIGMSELDGIAVSIGPGSFTGLRIGLSFAKGLAYSQGLPIVPVPTLACLANAGGDSEDTVKIVLYSHARIVYEQDYRYQGSIPESVSEIQVSEWNDLVTRTSPVHSLYHWGCDRLLDSYPVTSGVVKKVQPSARITGILADRHFSDWVVEKPFTLVPNYISPFIQPGSGTG